MSVLGLPSLAADDRLLAVLDAALRAAGQPSVRAPRCDPWSAAFFGLDRTSAWRGATPAQQQEIVRVAGQSLLEEAFYIEKCGMAYAATMSLRAQSTDERALYSLFAADEARHLCAVSGWVGEPGPPSAFHHLLVEVMERADPVGVVLIVQVLLEGWGLRHYRDLAAGCNDAALSAVLEGIVSDETRHHGSGVILLQQRELSAEGAAVAVELLCPFLTMVRAGPQGTLGALERVLGPLAWPDRVATLQELDTERHSAVRLELLHSLLQTRRAAPVRLELEARGMFNPLPAELAA